MGAEDYLPKSFDPVLLRARIGACLEKKRLRDQQRKMLHTFATREIAEQLKANGFTFGGKRIMGAFIAEYLHLTMIFGRC
jgi:DNA-binding response OmpR family regulator